MKNESWQYPFPTFDDKRFDSNKDGKLDRTETMFRDMHLNEMNRKADEYAKERSENSSGKSTINSNLTPETNADKKKPAQSNDSLGATLFVILLVIVISIGGFVLAFKVDGSAFVRALIIFSAVGISLFFLSATGLYDF